MKAVSNLNKRVLKTSMSIPDVCPLAQGGLCKPYGRLYVNLDESNELGTFILRTTGFNSIRTLAARSSYYHATLMFTFTTDFTRQVYDTELSNACVLRRFNFKGSSQPTGSNSNGSRN